VDSNFQYAEAVKLIVAPFSALFAEQSQSILDSLMELLARAERAMAQPRQRSRRSSTVNTARYLERLLRPEAASITLINRENYWVDQPMPGPHRHQPSPIDGRRWFIVGAAGLARVDAAGWVVGRRPARCRLASARLCDESAATVMHDRILHRHLPPGAAMRWRCCSSASPGL
jgi:hypothetical protein